MTIQYVLTSLGIGGLETRYSNLYKYYTENDQLNKIVFIISRSQYINFIDIYSTQNDQVEVRKHGLKIKEQSKLFILNKILKYTHLLVFYFEVILNQRIKADVTHFVDDNSIFLFRVLKGSRNIKSFYNGLRPEAQISQQRKRIYFLLNKGFLFDCLSESIKTVIIKAFPSFRSQIFSSPCSYSDYSFTESSWSKKENAIAFVSRLDHGKGIGLLINAIKQLDEEASEITVYICGNGFYENLLMSEISQMKNIDVKMLGHIRDPKRILKRTKIFLSLQDNENYPSQSLLEAMACGNAIIATDVGETQRIVKPNFGRLVPKDDTSRLHHEIIKMFSSFELDLMAKHAREFALTEHTIEKFWNYLSFLYKC